MTPPLEGAYVVIDNGRVSEIARRAPAGAAVEDLGDALLIPGLVNAHCHLEFSDLKKPIGKPGNPLPAWIRSILTGRLTAKKVEKGIATGLAASAEAGVTTIGEICRLPSRGYLGGRMMPRVALMQESIGFSQARSQSALTAAKKALAELDALVQEAPAGRLSVGV
ncbi:MAG: amidohydrolase family protein, partial [Planctomycetota bacterium]